QLRHRADSLFDRRRRIDPVLVVEVDHLDAEALETRLARRAHVITLAADAEAAPVLASHDAELRGDHDAIAPAADRFAAELLVVADPLQFRRIEKIDAKVERAPKRRDRLVFVALPVELRHAHTAEPEARNSQRASS